MCQNVVTIGTQTTEGTGKTDPAKAEKVNFTLVFQVTTNEHTYSHQEANREGSSTARRSNRNDHISWR